MRGVSRHTRQIKISPRGTLTKLNGTRCLHPVENVIIFNRHREFYIIALRVINFQRDITISSLIFELNCWVRNGLFVGLVISKVGYREWYGSVMRLTRYFQPL